MFILNVEVVSQPIKFVNSSTSFIKHSLGDYAVQTAVIFHQVLYIHVTLWVIGAVLKYCVFRVKLYLTVNHLKQSNTMRGSSIIARAPPSCINEEHSATSVLFFA